ncbi:MAG TPA: hypothetical protein VGH32_09430 [Pirellulales bacterium]
MNYDRAPTDPSRQTGPFQFRLRTLLIVVTVFCVVAGWLAGYLYRGVSTSLDAEMTHQAHVVALDALTRFVQATGRWPKSWDELAAAESGQRGRLRDWPRGMDDLQSRVKINFQLELKDIATMTPETFTGVEQRSPNYGPNDDWVGTLLDEVRKARSNGKAR